MGNVMIFGKIIQKWDVSEIIFSGMATPCGVR